jgi:hypothetical protein
MESDDDIDLALLRQAVAWNNLTEALRDGGPVPDPGYWCSLVSDVINRRRTLPTGQLIRRARLMPPEHVANVIDPYPVSGMGPPPPERATAARLSRKGAPVFYGTLDTDTAVAEMRPWARARITVATFYAASSLELADLTSGDGPTSRTPSLEYLRFLLARPVHHAVVDSYLASQQLADDVRAAGLAGILYDSSLSPGGTNVMLFSATNLEGRTTALYEVSGVAYKTTILSDDA